MGFKPEQMGSLTQFPTKKNVTSWRQEEITISGNALKTIHFSDTTPNMFYVQNTNDVYVLAGITKTPTETSYEYRVEKNTSMTFGRPVPTRSIHFLNPSNKDITITLFSIYDTFDINILKNTFFNMEEMGDFVYDGIIKGFSNGVSLPSGTNKIGKVGIDGAIPTGNNKIGKIDLASPIPSGTNNIGIVSLDNESKNDIAEIKANVASIAGKVTKSDIIDFIYYERENYNGTVTITFANEAFIPNYINFISNDEDNNIVVTITLTNGNTKTFTLRNGDIFGEVKTEIASITIAPKTSGSAVTWRAMFGLRG